MGLTLTVAPNEEPIGLAEAKLHLRVDGNTEDALIGAIIVAARQQAEYLTGRALVTQEWSLTAPAFPYGGDLSIYLPRPPLQAIDSITYLDADGSPQTLAMAAYQVVTDELVGRAVPAYGQSWPTCREMPGAVEVAFTAGYGAAADVPQDIKHWMLLTIATLYAQREAIVIGTIGEIPRQFHDGLLDGYRLWRVA